MNLCAAKAKAMDDLRPRHIEMTLALNSLDIQVGQVTKIGIELVSGEHIDLPVRLSARSDDKTACTTKYIFAEL